MGRIHASEWSAGNLFVYLGFLQRIAPTDAPRVYEQMTYGVRQIGSLVIYGFWV